MQKNDMASFMNISFFENKEFERLWESEPSFLTVKGMKIRYYKNDDWIYKSPDGKYETSIGVAEGNILIEYAKGEVGIAHTKAGLNFVKQIVRRVGLENQHYYYIADSTNITKASFKSRKIVVEFHERNKNIKQFILITNAFTRVLLKLMTPINPEVINNWMTSDSVENALYKILFKPKKKSSDTHSQTLLEKRIDQMYNMISQISMKKFDEIEPIKISNDDPFHGVFTALEILKNDNKEILQEMNTLLDNSYQALKEQELKVLSAKYESLKNQIDPHFLFNSLNVLVELIDKNQNEAIHFVTELGKIYRYVLKYMNQELVNIETELSFVKSFTYLLKIRYGDNLSININCPMADKFMIPPLTLQLLIENCIKHNIATPEAPLIITILIEDSYLIVSNNLQIKAVIFESSKMGLKSIQDRYKYFSNIPVSIINDKGKFVIKLPLLRMQETSEV